MANISGGGGVMGVRVRLKYLLLDLDLKAKDLAEALGVSEAQVSTWAKGRVTPRLEMALRIAKALRRPVEDIFELDDPE